MKLLFASDSFKGTLTSEETSELLTKAAQEVFGEGVECAFVPVADGGEGTTAAVIAAVGGSFVSANVHDPLMKPIAARYGMMSGNRAVMEMAAASGLPLVERNARNPLMTSTVGTGELLKDALDRGLSEVFMAIGGSATNDGGMGCASALGMRFFDESDNVLPGRGCDLERVAHIDVENADRRLRDLSLTVMSDVTNPLCGDTGATMTFGRQKGADDAMLARLERGMCNYRDVIRREFGKDPDAIRGGGAAGGLGTALAVFFGAKMKSGIETVLGLTDFDSRLRGVDLVVTGEGRLDWQSCMGKVVQGIGDHCKRSGVKAVALVGCTGRGFEQICDHGISSVFTTVREGMSVAESIAHPRESYLAAARHMFFEIAHNAPAMLAK